MLNVSAESRPIHRPRYLPIVGRYVDHHSADIRRSISRPTYLGRHIGRESTDMSTDISTDTRPICRPIHRSRIGRYVDRYIGRGVHKIHMIQAMKEAKSPPLFVSPFQVALVFLRETRNVMAWDGLRRGYTWWLFWHRLTRHFCQYNQNHQSGKSAVRILNCGLQKTYHVMTKESCHMT